MSLTSASRLLRSLTASPLAVERRTLDAFLGILRARGLGASFDGAALHAEMGIPEPREPSEQGSTDRAVAVIPVVGVISNRAHSMGAGADVIGAAVSRAAANDRISAIVLDIDSPGGTVTGVPELAEKIFQARQAKPVVAVANGLMASAAYWIGAAASEVVATPSGEVGSIGVFMLHEDWSQYLENEGVKITEIKAGRYKTEGAPWRPLDEAAEAHFSAQVREAYDWFVRDVARFRRDSQRNVREGYGEGRVLTADAAKAANLVDRVETIEETIDRLARRGSRRRGARAAVEARKRARARGY